MDKNDNWVRAQRSGKKRLIFAGVGICVVIPAIMLLSYLYLDSSRYIVSSILILIVAIAPFFMVFEHRKPKAREVVIIAMMSSVVVFSQMAVYIVLPVQIGTMLVIVSGISLGAESGFMIGAISRFILNFYMGQGPWTPWEMFCWGIIGFISGLVFNKVEIRRNKAFDILETNENQKKSRNFKIILGPVLCVFIAILVAYVVFMFKAGSEESFFGWRLYVYGLAGLIVGVAVQRKRLPVDNITITIFTIFIAFIVYGGIMNVCAMVTAAGIPGNNPISWDTLRALYITGVPYDLSHAVTAGVFTFIFGSAIINKLERIKIKYGIYRN